MRQEQWQVIDRHLAGEGSDADERQILAWSQEPAFAEMLRQLRSTSAANSWDVEAGWAAVRARTADVPQRHARWWVGSHASRVAAAVVVAAAIGAGVWGAQRGPSGAPASFVEIATRNGQRDSVTLPDGSRLLLNAGTRVRYQVGATHGDRIVFLEGEALFEVRHDASRPFRVHAKGAVAQDLGTRFTVRAYPELATVDVAVIEGVVSLRRGSSVDSLLLRPGAVGRVEAEGPPHAVPGTDLAPYEGWTGGALVLDRIPLRDAVAQLQRRYDVVIELGDSTLANRRVAARVGNEPLTDVLDAMALALGASVRREGNRIVLTSINR